LLFIRKDKNLTASLTLVLSCKGGEKMKGKILKDPSPLPSPAGWRGLMKGKEFDGTPHFGSLLQGEIRDGRKNFKRPLTLALSRGVEREE
jgi:hypothetical protein